LNSTLEQKNTHGLIVTIPVRTSDRKVFLSGLQSFAIVTHYD